MSKDRQKLLKTAGFLKHKLKNFLKNKPLIGLILGTGLNKTPDSLNIVKEFQYSKFFYFCEKKKQGNEGKLIFGEIADKNIMIMNKRFHLYEGYTPYQVAFPIRVMQNLGVKTLIISNAAGGINLDFSSQDIMLVTDHINLTGKNPLRGDNDDKFGIRFPDMSKVYDSALIKIAKKVGRKHNISIKTGVYAGLLGPSLETPAEIRFLKKIGCDAVGFSLVTEAITGVHAGMKILGLSLITNINDPDNPELTTIQKVLDTAKMAIKPFNKLLYKTIEKL